MLYLMSLGLLVLMSVAVFISIYNKLVSLRNRYQNSYAQIDVQLKRRYDLIPNLVETAKAYLKHERETLEAVIQARNQAVAASGRASSNPGDPTSMATLMSAEGALGSALGRLFALNESYPDLKADKTINQLHEELTSTENKIAFARQSYNDAVMFYNTSREVFPNNVIAGMFQFNQASLFETSRPEERETVKVAFN